MQFKIFTYNIDCIYEREGVIMNSTYSNKQDCTSPDKIITDTCPIAIEALPVGVICCMLDRDLTFIWGNSCFFNSIGYSKVEYMHLFINLHQYYKEYSESYESLQHALAQTIDNKESKLELTIQLPLKAGSYSWARLSGTIITYTEQLPIFQATLTDVTALMKEKEEQTFLYKQKFQYFHWMMDVYVGNIYVSDMNTYELLFINETACKTLGMPVHKVLGQKCYEIIQGRTSPCSFCTNDKLTEDSFYEWEFYNPILERTFIIKNRIINWEGHRARIELSHDMYSAEYKLAKKDQERETLVRSIPGGFARLDARDFSTILWYGAEFLDLIGYTAEQFENELHSQCTYIHPDDYARIIAILKEIQTTEENIITESRLITRSGKVKTITLTLRYVSAEKSWDKIPSYYSVGLDITKEREEEVRQRKALEDAYKLARISNEAKTNFLSSMSHDIRTPMNAILGMAYIAQANLTSPEKVHDCLSKINLSGQHLLNLINEVLDMSKIESGKIDLSSEIVSFPELFQNVMDMCQPLISDKNQELQISASHVQHENVVTDGSRLQQVFMNLLSNSIKYSPAGGIIRLHIRELPSLSENKGQYEFILTDNGIGMSEDYLPHIFEPFSRAEDSRISKIQGTGLGMAITENIIRMMNGTIEVKSKLGEGSQFIVSVSFEIFTEEEKNEAELSGLPVLVVDDDQIVCESATALLNELGMCGYWVQSGKEAVQRIVAAHESAEDFFAVILDWKMPDMDGLETVKEIRKKLGMEVPIIIISAYDYSNIEDEFKQAGADAFITKPLFKSKMLHVLQLFCHCETITPAPKSHKDVITLSGKRVLLVEDNDLNRELATELLQMHDLVVEAVENGKVAVEQFQNSDPGYYSCILMDIQMPIMNGYESTETIRNLNREDAKTIPIFALTANAFASDLGKAHSVGMDEHIAKPIDIDRLLEILQKWLG